jgi:hypothetical protein
MVRLRDVNIGHHDCVLEVTFKYMAQVLGLI